MPEGRTFARALAWLGLALSACAAPPAMRPADSPAAEAAPFATAASRFGGFADAIVREVNRDRRAAGVEPVVADRFATRFAEDEARRLVREGSFGHRAGDGSQPYQRWTRRGETARVGENLFSLTAAGPRAYMLFDPRRAHERLMRSEGHRRNVLDPLHTGLGVVVAYDPAKNRVIVVEEFVDRRLAVLAGSRHWRAGETRELRGRVLPGADVVPRMAALYREPAPGGRATRQPSRQSSMEGGPAAEVVLPARAFTFDRASGEFALSARVPAGATPGPYTWMLYVTAPHAAGADGPRLVWPGAILTYDVIR